MSKKVEAVGHRVTPCRRDTLQQDKTFSIRNSFAFKLLSGVIFSQFHEYFHCKLCFIIVFKSYMNRILLK